MSRSQASETFGARAPGRAGRRCGAALLTGAALMMALVLPTAARADSAPLKEYRARVRLLADGRVAVAVTRLTGSASEALLGAEVVVPGLVYNPGMQLEIHFQVSGTGTTALAATVWASDTDEPDVEPDRHGGVAAVAGRGGAGGLPVGQHDRLRGAEPRRPGSRPGGRLTRAAPSCGGRRPTAAPPRRRRGRSPRGRYG